MNQFVVISAKTLDEAVTKGCAELGVALDEVDFEIIDEGGLFRKMQVKVSVKADKAAVKAAPVKEVAEPVQVTEKAAEKSVEKNTKPAPKSAAPKKDQVQVEAGSVEEFEIGGKTPSKRSAKAPRPVTEFNPDCPKFTKALAFAEEFFRLMGDGLTVTTSHDDQEFLISVHGENETVSRLIGKNGHTLAAINTLVSTVAINAHTDEPRRVAVDIGDYRAHRHDYLVELAKRKAEQVKNTGRAVRLDPMPARERVIVHMTLQDVEGVTTQSEGTEPRRYLVIKPGAR